MRTQYRCPVDGCGTVFESASGLRGHMAGTMQHDDAHKWRNVPVSHDNLSAAKERVPGVSEIAREALALWLDEHEQED